jgi:cytidyltransferase-like protein
MSSKKIFVTGCFDMLHSGHVAFLKEAASFGNLFVCIGSDKTVHQLKGRPTINSQDERKYMIESLSCVHECLINSGSGIIDFEKELALVKPDIFIVNEDGHTHQKEMLCKELGIEYKVLLRKPYADLPARSTTSLRSVSNIPFRIDLAGGWLDQPFVSKFYPGPVLTISIEPTVEFNNRSGMASSTRNKAIELWRTEIPDGDREQLAKLLFSYENPPGTKEIAGSQDSLGIVMPGLNRHYYAGNYWPQKIESVHDEDVLSWLENKLYLVTLGPRDNSYVVIENTNISEEGAKKLSDAAEVCWKAILAKDINSFGKSFAESFHAQVAMFPNMADENIYNQIDQYKNKVIGYKLSGAGGGGYLILVSPDPVKDAMQIKIRRKNWV